MADPDLERLEQRSEELHEQIEETRRQAQKDHLIPDPHHPPTFADPDADGEEGDLGPVGGL
jgi:hypothetical protein